MLEIGVPIGTRETPPLSGASQYVATMVVSVGP
jgi:hypothetical protein